MPMEEFDSASSENSYSNDGEANANLWICGASKATIVTNGLEWVKVAEDEMYSKIPFPQRKVGTN